jgi:hypothetical protein
MSRTSRSPVVAAPLLAAPLLAALAAGVLSACGTADPQLPQASSATATKQASFPLTVQRTGGIAGFRDTVSIDADGHVLAGTRQGQVSCDLDQASLALLNDAALQVHDTDQPTAPPADQSDAMTVVFGAGTGLLAINDSRVARAEPVVTQLLADVTGPAADRKVCT